MWFSGEDRLRKGPKEMEEQKQAERQWNKIRRERINILKEAPSEENLWQAVMAFQDYPFKTVTGLPFQYTLKTGKNGEWTKELWIDRREKSKSLSWSSVVLAFKNSRKIRSWRRRCWDEKKRAVLLLCPGMTLLCGCSKKAALP